MSGPGLCQGQPDPAASRPDQQEYCHGCCHSGLASAASCEEEGEGREEGARRRGRGRGGGILEREGGGWDLVRERRGEEEVVGEKRAGGGGAPWGDRNRIVGEGKKERGPTERERRHTGKERPQDRENKRLRSLYVTDPGPPNSTNRVTTHGSHFQLEQNLQWRFCKAGFIAKPPLEGSNSFYFLFLVQYTCILDYN
ncbi:hypothetical protein BRADI_3g26221v3 [Brachypodium distachyon]|uniref:Uncharacterized protein n=1 Tax=Brachypodium distachyon TaxID=15368 RepID=A0A2K2CZB1_BRADI|nr:hypothetical protein BRADI_3g26221v3 [Brachypodium distachyon]